MAGFSLRTLSGRIPRAGAQARKPAFTRSEDGSITIFTLFIFCVMFMIAGLAVDVMRFETKRVQVQNTLDRAILAAADLEQTLPPVQVVNAYFTSAGLSDLIVDTSVSEGLNYRTVAASTTARVDSLFIQTMGIDFMNAPAQGIADERVSDVEISLVLDVSGSMSGTKIASLKTAAKQFVDTVMATSSGAATSDSLTHISIVPYNHQSNAGSQLAGYLNFTGEHSNSYCADWTAADFATDTVTPTTEIRQTGHFDYSNYRGTHSYWMPECRLFAYNQIQPFISDPATAKSFIDTLVASGNTSIDIGAKWGITLLNPGLQPMITDMVGSGTLASAFDGRPYNYGEGALKVMILMTDGMNTSQYELTDGHRSGLSYLWHDPATNTLSVDLEAFAVAKGLDPAAEGLTASRRWFRQYGDYDTSSPTGGADAVQLTWQQVWQWGGLSYVHSKVMYRVYRESSVPWEIRRAGYYWRSNAHERFRTADKDPRASAICTAGKNKGVVIYTIGFESPASGDVVLADCASSAAHFFRASTTDIGDVFSAIATQINQLKLIY